MFPKLTATTDPATGSSTGCNVNLVIPLIVIKLTSNIFSLTIESVSAANTTRWPCSNNTPSTWWPDEPSTLLKASNVATSIKSTLGSPTDPKLNSFKSALNSIIGRLALRLIGYTAILPTDSALAVMTSLCTHRLYRDQGFKS